VRTGSCIARASAVEVLAEAPAAEAAPTTLNYRARSGGEAFVQNAKLAFALPWRRVKHGSVLVLKLAGKASRGEGRG